MNGDKIHDIPWLPASRGRHDFVGGEIHGMEHVAEKFILDNGKETKVAIHQPFQTGPLKSFAYFRCIYGRLSPQPHNFKTFTLQNLSISQSSLGNALFTIMKDVDVARKAERTTMKGSAASNITLRIAMGGY